MEVAGAGEGEDGGHRGERVNGGSGVRTLVREASAASKQVTTPPCAATRETG